MPNMIIPGETIEQKIYLLIGHKVILSVHMAKLYEVEARTLVQAVKRNIDNESMPFLVEIGKGIDSLRYI